MGRPDDILGIYDTQYVVHGITEHACMHAYESASISYIVRCYCYRPSIYYFRACSFVPAKEEADRASRPLSVHERRVGGACMMKWTRVT